MIGAQEIAEQVRDAAARQARLRVSGRGHWMTANRPVRADETLAVRECTGIVEYVPGDFVLTARAGTPLAQIADAAGTAGQWLPLDPPGSDDGSIGATVATASSGPLATAFGTPRDQLLGVEFVTGGGDIVRGGGRVVKNVAGFDLVRLATGAWGTLGVLTEVTVRLRAQPAEQETLSVTIADDANAIERLGADLRALRTMPMACELLNGESAARLDFPPALTLLIRIGGNAESMRAQRAALAAFGNGACRAIDADAWNRLRMVESAEDTVWRMSWRPSAFATTWTTAREMSAVARGTWMHGSPLRGTVRCGAPRPADETVAIERLMRAFTIPFGGARIGETLPAHAWSSLPSAAMDHLSRGVRVAFDPNGILNPGILGASA
ncbi:MAG: FAD-binding oxidoreductase [Gemmatimonadaceae bacterium]